MCSAYTSGRWRLSSAQKESSWLLTRGMSPLSSAASPAKQEQRLNRLRGSLSRSFNYIYGIIRDWLNRDRQTKNLWLGGKHGTRTSSPEEGGDEHVQVGQGSLAARFHIPAPPKPNKGSSLSIKSGESDAACTVEGMPPMRYRSKADLPLSSFPLLNLTVGGSGLWRTVCASLSGAGRSVKPGKNCSRYSPPIPFRQPYGGILLPPLRWHLTTKNRLRFARPMWRSSRS